MEGDPVASTGDALGALVGTTGGRVGPGAGGQLGTFVNG
jgi:hypothetical protein